VRRCKSPSVSPFTQSFERLDAATTDLDALGLVVKIYSEGWQSAKFLRDGVVSLFG
jgi:hypothetical protein